MTPRLPRGFQGASGAILLAFVWLAATTWVRPLMLPDEGRYVGVAWEMLRSGHWLVPTLDGLPYFHKPPLFYWITAASLSVFGQHEWAARVAPLAGGTIAAAALYLFASRWAGRRVARLALLVLVTQPLLFAGAQFANLDMLVAGCIAATVLAFASAILAMEQGQSARGALLAGYVFAALGLLAKGLIGIVLPGMVIVAWVLVLRRPRALLRILWLPGLIVFAAIGVPWFVAMQDRFPEFFNYFFIVQHFKRFTTTHFNNPAPFWFYLVILPVGALPWSGWLAAVARRRYWREPERGRLRLLMWLWLGLITLFFSLPKSKLIGYILPTTAPLAFIVADAITIATAAGGERSRRWVKATAAAAVAICLAVVVGVAAAPTKSLRAIGQALAQRVAPGEQVVFLNAYYFDLTYYGRLQAPARVVDNWNDPAVTSHDDWHKELFDAEHFQAPSAPPVLILPSALPQLLCTGHATWVVGSVSLLPRYPMFRSATEVARERDIALWRVPAGGVNVVPCSGKPSVNSAGM
ncbi:MAG TPA: glycosyltransferase family 39 protein [Ramlibacter sp.]|nr:glycosyltransferase family 39 protein [Ramlibacter sp.]